MPLSPMQAASIAEAVAPVNIWDGSVSGGKTFASELAWLDWVATAPPGPLLMVGHTLTTLEENILFPLADQFFSDYPGALTHTRGSTYAKVLGRTVRTMGANDRTAEGKIRGMSLAGAYVDEATLLPEDFWNMLGTRLRIPGARLFATTNPDNPNHWLKKKWIDKADELGIARWRFGMDDNPTLTEEYRARMRAQYTGLFYRRFIDGEWVAAQGAIYDMLDLDDGGRHRLQADEVRWTDRCWLGIDYGTLAPFHAVLLRLGLHGSRDVLGVAGEWRWDSTKEYRQLDPTEYEARLRAWLDQLGLWPERIAIDPSAAEFRTLLRNRGWTGLTTSDEQINPVKAGIQAVSGLLASRRLLFLAGAAPELETELLGYVWDEKAQEQGEDRPLKQDDHGADALRYIVMGTRAVWRPWLAAG
ncbi:MAG TPA: PBSX family phage terminase large subunit [Spirillospora sp.]|nr:PBSX family phage terminase large subunit [Spirillospora sp.]